MYRLETRYILHAPFARRSIYNQVIEFILLSDTLGVSSLVDILNNAKPAGATESTVLGPFYTEETKDGTFLYFINKPLRFHGIYYPISQARRLDCLRRQR